MGSVGNSSCRALAVMALLCLAASTASGKTDTTIGVGILIQPNPPPRTVVKLPPQSVSGSTGGSTSAPAAAGASLPPPPAADAAADVPGTAAGSRATGTDAALAAAMANAAAGATAQTVPLAGTVAGGAVASVTVTATVTTTADAGEAPTSITVVTTVPATQLTATPAAEPAAAPVHPMLPAAHPVLGPTFAKTSQSHLPSSQQLAANTTQQPLPTPAAPTPAAHTASNTSSGPKLQPVISVPPAGNSQLPPMLMAGPTVKAPPPFLFTQKGANKTIKIGCSVPFEGSQKLVGEAVLAAVKMAITQLAPKELPGFNVNLTCINSKCEDIPAYMAVNKFANEGAIGVIGDICSRASVAAAGVANMRKLPVISPASTSPSLSSTDFFFRTVPSDKFQGVTAANLVRKSGVNSTALVYEDSAYGYGLAFNFIAGFTKDRGTVPVVYQFKPGQGDPKAAVTEIKAGVNDKKVQAVFISVNNLTFAADFLVAAKAANLSLPIFGGDALSDYTLYENLNGRPSLIGQLTSTSVSPGSQEFVRAYANFTGTNPATSYQAYAAHAYDAVAALLYAYKAAAPPKDGPAIKEQLQQQDFKGVAGHVVFDAFGDLVPDNKTYVSVYFNATSGARVVKDFIAK